jgi:CubicO group peptidase (beta-lactamase class C family)
MRWRRALAGAALLVATVGTQARPAADPRIAAVERGLLPAVVTEATVPMTLADRMRHHGVPGVSVAVVDGGRLVWAQAWGLAQAGQAQTLSTTTLMQAGSISKPLAAFGALKLVQQGRLALDADIAPQLRRWQLPPGAQTAEKPVTVRGLLGHTAGLSVHGFAGYVPGQPLPTLAQVLDGVAPANSEPVRVRAVPGSEWRYSGGGYVLLQLLMEDLTGEPFAPWMAREVLRPAGMPTSRYGRLPAAPSSTAAAGHMDGRVIDGRRANMVEEAAGGLWTTPTELARLSLALQRAMAGQDQPWIRASSLAQARQPQAVKGARTGLGLFLHGPTAFGHDGRNAGFDSSWMMDGQRALVVMVNANNFELIEEIRRAVAVAHGWDDLAPPRLSRAQVEAGFNAGPLYLRGSMNEWSTAAPLARADGRRYAVELALPAGRHEFKFASADWKAVDLGAGEGGLAIAGGNLVLDVPAAARYRFTLDASDVLRPRHAVERVAP